MKEYDVDMRKLENLSIYQLRDVGAKVGVRNPTAMRSDELRSAICAVVTGKQKPYHKAKSGRPHKDVISDDEWDDLVGFNSSFSFSTNNSTDMLSLYSPVSNIYPAEATKVYPGFVMEVQNQLIFAIGAPNELKLDKFARINYETENFSLVRVGDKITCTIAPGEERLDPPVVSEILTINGLTVDQVIANSNKKYTLSTPNTETESEPANDKNFSFKYPQLQFLSNNYPVKKGYRALFVGEQRSGQEFLANSLAKDLSKDCHVVYFSGNKNPEDRMDFNSNVDYFFSTFDVIPRNLIFNFEVAFNRAKNLAKQKNVVLIIDDLTDLISNYLDLMQLKNPSSSAENNFQNIVQQFRVLFATSRFSDRSSLTIFAFASAPQNNIIAECLSIIDKLANCHFGLDHDAFVSGADDFLDTATCRIDPAPRTVK